MRVAVVGYGNMGRNHVRVLREMGIEPFIVEPDTSGWETEFANLPAWPTLAALLADEAVDAVIVASPTETHFQIAITALRAGCAVLVEKPFTSTIAEANDVVWLARDQGLVLACGLIERFNPAVQVLRRKMAGLRVRLLSSRRSGLPMPALGLGVTAELATHDIDVMNYLVGDEPVGARGSVSTDGTIVEATLLYGTVLGSISADWLSPRKVRELRVLCDEGTFDLDYIEQSLIWQPVGGVPEAVPVVEDEPLRLELADFLARVAGLVAPTMDTADAALAAMRVVEQIEGAA